MPDETNQGTDRVKLAEALATLKLAAAISPRCHNKEPEQQVYIKDLLTPRNEATTLGQERESLPLSFDTKLNCSQYVLDSKYVEDCEKACGGLRELCRLSSNADDPHVLSGPKHNQSRVDSCDDTADLMVPIESYQATLRRWADCESHNRQLLKELQEAKADCETQNRQLLKDLYSAQDRARQAQTRSIKQASGIPLDPYQALEARYQDDLRASKMEHQEFKKEANARVSQLESDLQSVLDQVSKQARADARMNVHLLEDMTKRPNDLEAKRIAQKREFETLQEQRRRLTRQTGNLMQKHRERQLSATQKSQVVRFSSMPTTGFGRDPSHVVVQTSQPKTRSATCVVASSSPLQVRRTTISPRR
jgi:hypothetical protein